MKYFLFNNHYKARFCVTKCLTIKTDGMIKFKARTVVRRIVQRNWKDVYRPLTTRLSSILYSSHTSLFYLLSNIESHFHTFKASLEYLHCLWENFWFDFLEYGQCLNIPVHLSLHICVWFHSVSLSSDTHTSHILRLSRITQSTLRLYLLLFFSR